MAEDTQLDELNSKWETESGLIDDIDAVIRNPRFGTKEEYAQAVVLTGTDAATGLMFLADLVDDDGNELAQQGWSVGGGWTPSDDGKTISHPKRVNVVTSSMYGQLQNVVIKELKVPMYMYGEPLNASSWNGLKFHWMLKIHKTVSGAEKQGLMPTEFFGKVEGSEAPAATTAKATAKPVAKKAAPAVSKARDLASSLVGSFDNAESFIKAAVKNKTIAEDDALMAEIMNDGEDGFYAVTKAAAG